MKKSGMEKLNANKQQVFLMMRSAIHQRSSGSNRLMNREDAQHEELQHCAHFSSELVRKAHLKQRSTSVPAEEKCAGERRFLSYGYHGMNFVLFVRKNAVNTRVGRAGKGCLNKRISPLRRGKTPTTGRSLVGLPIRRGAAAKNHLKTNKTIIIKSLVRERSHDRSKEPHSTKGSLSCEQPRRTE
ncbi:hypothetical protein HUJ05_012435 [Dendroctonus ponderosae]|nr:hypothetical protein HUJ05_012435 [Dendroctonus ponderosae]